MLERSKVNFEYVRRELNVVICINQGVGLFRNSPLNKWLNDLQKSLLEEKKKCYNNVNVAYVYENSRLNVQHFNKLSDKSIKTFVEPSTSGRDHNLYHLFIMSLSIINDRYLECGDGEEYRLYFLSDTDANITVNKIEEIVGTDGKMGYLKERFLVIDVLKKYLYTNSVFSIDEMDKSRRSGNRLEKLFDEVTFLQ